MSHLAAILHQPVPKHVAGNHQQCRDQKDKQDALAPAARPADCVCVRQHAIDAHWIGDVLDLAVPERLVAAYDLVLDLLVDRTRDIDLTGLGNALDACGDVDAVAVDIIRLYDDVAEIDANPVFEPRMLRKRGVAADQILLDDDAASNGLDGAIENGDEAIARRLHQRAMVLDDAGLDDIPFDPLDASMRSLLVVLHDATVRGDITDDDRRKATRHGAVRGRPVLVSGSEVANFAHCGDSTRDKRRPHSTTAKSNRM